MHIWNSWLDLVTKSEQVFNFHDYVMIMSSTLDGVGSPRSMALCVAFIQYPIYIIYYIATHIFLIYKYNIPNCKHTHTCTCVHVWHKFIWNGFVCACVCINCITKAKKRSKFQKGHRSWCACLYIYIYI